MKRPSRFFFCFRDPSIFVQTGSLNQIAKSCQIEMEAKPPEKYSNNRLETQRVRTGEKIWKDH